VIEKGKRVSVPFGRGSRKVTGMVFDVVTQEYNPYEVKKAAEVLDSEAYMNDEMLCLAKWLKENTFCTYYHAIRCILPPVLRNNTDFPKSKTEKIVQLAENAEIPNELTPKQKSVLDILENGGASVKELCYLCNITAGVVTNLVKKGILQEFSQEINLKEDEEIVERSIDGLILTLPQNEAFHKLQKLLKSNEPKCALLHGVTGSGKTSVFIKLVGECLNPSDGGVGKAAMILVPEISLTPQTIARFERALKTSCAVIHSRMSAGERRDAIESIMLGERKLLIGVRSAILAPMDNVGLIVVDEEHDSSYKQTDPEPRYNARDTAIMRAKLQNAKIILGSATPSFESFYNCQIGKYERIDLQNRHIGAKLPEVKIVNMLKTANNGKKTIISNELRENIQKCLDENKQIILFLNRRGYSVNLVCDGCGQVKFCPRCSVGLVYHRNGDILRCHVCGHSENPNYKCENCGNETVKYEGFGIQKVEDELKLLFAEAKVLRMDADTTGSKNGHSKIIEDFAEKKYNILLGTQMVAKGLDFANVKLVGVLQADIGFSAPDFRAGERMFQLLAQVAGRAGRADDDGLVIIQTFSPEEPSIKFAQKHDYTGYFNATIDSRKRVGFPPFVKIAKIKITGENEEESSAFSKKIADFLHQNAKNIKILGPVESSVFKVENKFNFVMLIKSPNYKTLCDALDVLRKTLPQKNKNATVSYKIDVDPTNLW
jgi:primosomal protein N' (replication factor Y)